MPPFNAFMRRMREQRGWTVPDLSRRVTINALLLDRIEHGTTAPTVTQAAAIAEAFGLTVQDAALLLFNWRPPVAVLPVLTRYDATCFDDLARHDRSAAAVLLHDLLDGLVAQRLLARLTPAETVAQLLNPPGFSAIRVTLAYPPLDVHQIRGQARSGAALVDDDVRAYVHARHGISRTTHRRRQSMAVLDRLRSTSLAHMKLFAVQQADVDLKEEGFLFQLAWNLIEQPSPASWALIMISRWYTWLNNGSLTTNWLADLRLSLPPIQGGAQDVQPNCDDRSHSPRHDAVPSRFAGAGDR